MPSEPTAEQAEVRRKGRQRLVGAVVLARGTVVRHDADLDEPVGLQGGVGLFDDGGCEALGADHDDGVEVVSVGAVRLALGRGQNQCRHFADYR